MIAVDTNVLVRILVDDPGQPAQTSAARTLASEAGAVYVPLIVMVETVCVLENGYRLAKDAVVRVLEHLAVNQAFVLEAEDLCHDALALYRSSNAAYADCLILSACRAKDLVTHTFDKRLAKLPGAKLVST